MADNKHNYGFEGGEYLTKISASWFVSYAFHLYIDNKHDNFMNIKSEKSIMSRKKTYAKTAQYHKFWLQKITEMSPKKLSTNTIGLTGEAIVCMATNLLNVLEHK